MSDVPANDNKDLTWELDGPDEEGKVWLFDKGYKEGKCLGDYEAVATAFADWLAKNDFGEG